jgi:hypothetical protein
VTPPPVYKRRLYRDLAAAALMLVGGGGFVVFAFLIDPLAGAVTLSAIAFAAGVYLGIDR